MNAQAHRETNQHWEQQRGWDPALIRPSEFSASGSLLSAVMILTQFPSCAPRGGLESGLLCGEKGGGRTEAALLVKSAALLCWAMEKQLEA